MSHIKRGLIPLMLFLMLFITISNTFLVSENVDASTMLEYFDDEFLNDNATEGLWFESGCVNPTLGHSEYFRTQNTQVYSNGMGFKTRCGGVTGLSGTWGGGYWNFTTVNNITEVEFKVKWTTEAVASTPATYFLFNSSTDFLYGIRIILDNGVPTAQFQTYDGVHNILTDVGKSFWYTINFHVNSSNQIWLRIYNTSTLTLMASYTISTTKDVYDFEHIYFRSSTTNTHTFIYIDDLAVSSGLYDYYYYLDQYCHSYAKQTFKTLQKYIEMQYPSAHTFSGYIRAFDLIVHQHQITQISSSMYDYELFINGTNVGHPSEYEWVYDEYYALKWREFNISVENSNPVFELYCSAEENVYGWHWWLGSGGNTGVYYRNHNSDWRYGNGILDGGGSAYETPVWCMYYGSIPSTYNVTFDCEWNITNPIKFNNWFDIYVNIEPADGIYYRIENATGDVFYEGSWGNYWNRHYVSDIWIYEEMGIGTYSFLVIPFSEKEGWGWDYTIDYEYNFNVSTGTPFPYGLQLETKTFPEGVPRTYSFKADSNEPIYILAVRNDYPDGTTIYYNSSWMYGDGSTWIEMKDAMLINNPDSCDTCGYTLRMYNASGNIWQVEQYFLVTSGITDFSLQVTPKEIELGEYVSFIGSHTFNIESDHILRINIKHEDKWVSYIPIVKGQHEFNFQYQPKHIGEYKAYLEYGSELLGDGYYVRFNVLSPSDEQIDNDISYMIKTLPALFKGMAGVFITLGFAMIPLLLTFELKRLNTTVEIPPVLYVVFGGTGSILCVFAGLWEWEVPFFLMAISVTITLLIYLMGKRNGE